MAEDIHTSLPCAGSSLFVEDLPVECPPLDANEEPLANACRFYFFDDGDERNYHSHHALKKDCRDSGECKCKSISLQNEVSIQKIATAKRHSFFKSLPIATHDIPQGSGKSLVGKSGHIDFWPYQGFDFKLCRTGLFETIHDLIEALSDEA